MTPRLILHIGFPRCGSTTLQRFLIRNQRQLREDGVVVIDQDFAHPGRGRARAVAQVRLGTLLPTPEAGREIATALDRIARKMARLGDRVAVMSSESLSNGLHYPQFFAQAAQDFDVTVLAYVRPQDRWLPSAWKQFGLRTGASLESYVDTALTRGLPKFLATLEAWEEVFGRDAMVVRPMNRPALAQGDLLTDFCLQMGWDRERLTGTDGLPPSNRTFDFHVLRVLEEAHGVLEGPNTGRMFRHLGQRLPAAAFAEGRVPLDPARRRQIMAACETNNRKLAERYFPDLPFEAAFGAADADAPRDIDDDLATATARTVAYLLAMNMEQAEELERLRQRLRKLEAMSGNSAARGTE